MNHPKRKKDGLKAVKRLRTIAKAKVNGISRKMSDARCHFTERTTIEIVNENLQTWRKTRNLQSICKNNHFVIVSAFAERR